MLSTVESILGCGAIKVGRKDFVSDQDVRWCPGCGDYSILAQMHRMLPDLGVPRENIVFISGIGCSSRFPYYVNTYGIHSIHGRAPTLATGLKLARPELKVFVITGDGDGLSIGGNHLIHAMRRNVDITVVLFNNQIYGLTKGQFSPTSLAGHKTKSSPMGSLSQPLNPLSVALAAEATFVARSIDVETKHLQSVLLAAAEHKGASFVEVYQNCVIFNDGAWKHTTDRSVKLDNLLYLEHGKPMIFGRNSDRGIVLHGLDPKVVVLGQGWTTSDILIHDAHRRGPSRAFLLSRMTYPEFPVPIGIFRQVEAPTYEQALEQQIQMAVEQKGEGELRELYCKSDLWAVGGENIQGIDEEEGSVSLGTGGYSPAVGKAILDGWSDVISRAQRRLVETPLSDLDLDEAVCFEDTTLVEDIVSSPSGLGAIIVVCDGNGKLAGVVTRDELWYAVLSGRVRGTVRIGDMSTSLPVLKYDHPVARAVHAMHTSEVTALPVVDASHKPLGVVTARNLLRFMFG